MGFHELFIGLARESNNDVCCNGATRNSLADLGNQVTIVLLCIPALHVSEHLVIACLNRDLDVRHYFWQLSKRIHEIFAKIIRMRGEETDAFDAIHFMDHAQEPSQIWSVRNVLAVAVHDLPEERYFLDALFGERTDLCDDITDGTTALDTASERDDTERTSM